jgi:hypothetical protein
VRFFYVAGGAINILILSLFVVAKIAVDSKDGGHIGEEDAQDDDDYGNAAIPDKVRLVEQFQPGKGLVDGPQGNG